jgi:hypothetical protein
MKREGGRGGWGGGDGSGMGGGGRRKYARVFWGGPLRWWGCGWGMHVKASEQQGALVCE